MSAKAEFKNDLGEKPLNSAVAENVNLAENAALNKPLSAENAATAGSAAAENSQNAAQNPTPSAENSRPSQENSQNSSQNEPLAQNLAAQNSTTNSQNSAVNSQILEPNPAQNSAQLPQENSQNLAAQNAQILEQNPSPQNSQIPPQISQENSQKTQTAELLNNAQTPTIAELLAAQSASKNELTTKPKKGLMQKIKGKKLLENLKVLRQKQGLKRLQSSTFAQKIKDIILFNSYKSVLFLMGFVVLYYLFFAADRYVSEATISVRATSANASTEAVGSLGALLGTGSSSEDINHLKSYILSLDMLMALDAKIGIRDLYESQKLDFLFALYKDDDQETFLKYYKERVKVSDIDGLLNIQVEGFKPEQSYLIATEILAQSEHFVNEISHKGAREQLVFAENELAKYKDRYQQATNALTAFQSEHGVFDPLKESGARVGFIGTMEANLAEKEAALLALQSYMNDDAPKIVTLKAEIAALKQQMQKEKARVAPGENSEENSLENGDFGGNLGVDLNSQILENAQNSQINSQNLQANSQNSQNENQIPQIPQNSQSAQNALNQALQNANLSSQNENSQTQKGVNLSQILNQNSRNFAANSAATQSQTTPQNQNSQNQIAANAENSQLAAQNSRNLSESVNLNSQISQNPPQNSQNSQNQIHAITPKNPQFPQFSQINSQRGPNELLSEFQRLSVEAEFAQSAYTSALTALETTRIEAIRKIKQLVIIQSPTKPESALYPRTLYNIFTILIILSLFYGVVRLVRTIIEEHKY